MVPSAVSKQFRLENTIPCGRCAWFLCFGEAEPCACFSDKVKRGNLKSKREGKCLFCVSTPYVLVNLFYYTSPELKSGPFYTVKRRACDFVLHTINAAYHSKKTRERNSSHNEAFTTGNLTNGAAHKVKESCGGFKRIGLGS